MEHHQHRLSRAKEAAKPAPQGGNMKPEGVELAMAGGSHLALEPTLRAINAALPTVSKNRHQSKTPKINRDPRDRAPVSGKEKAAARRGFITIETARDSKSNSARHCRNAPV